MYNKREQGRPSANLQQKTVPVLGCSGLIFACRVDLRLLVGVCCWWRMLLDAPACMVTVLFP